jgi:hypothetical protein
MLGRLAGETETLSASGWVAQGFRLTPLWVGLAAVVLGLGAWLGGQVVVLDYTSPLVLEASVDQVVRPETPLRVSLQGAGAELRDVQLFRSNQPVPIQLLPDANAWRLVAPDGGSALQTDGDYRLVVSVLEARPAVPTPRTELVEREYRFGTVASPKPDLPTDVVHPRWAEPVSFAWSLPMQSVEATVDPPVPSRVWIDDKDPKRTWVQLGGEGGAGLADGQTYHVEVTDAVSTDGLRLRQADGFKIGVPTRPEFVDPPTEAVTLQYGESLTLTASMDLTDAQIEMSDDAPAQVTVNGKEVIIDVPDYQQGADFDVTVRSAMSPQGAPLAQPLTVHIHTPEALPTPTIDPVDGNRNVLPIDHPSITFPEPVADPDAATQALQIGPRTTEGGFLEGDVLTSFRTAHDKRIDVSLGGQRLTMIQDGIALRTIAVATGVAAAPTPPGTFYVQYKSPQMRFTGFNPDGSHYDIPDVHWVLPFWGDYTLHGAYWRPRFGVPGSDGCVSMTDAEAKVLYDWADVGTPVVIHQ